jgi:hypothetical protein
MSEPEQLTLFTTLSARHPSRITCVRCDRYVSSPRLLWCDTCAAVLMTEDRKAAKEEAR